MPLCSPLPSPPPTPTAPPPDALAHDAPPLPCPAPDAPAHDAHPLPCPAPDAPAHDAHDTSPKINKIFLSMTSELKREYEIGPEIGRGRFSTVYRCRSINGSAYAVKSIDKSALTDPTDLRSVLNEAKLTHLAAAGNPNVVGIPAAGNPNVVGIPAVYEDAEFIHLILDLCVGPDLFDRVSAGAPFLEAEAAGILRQLTEAIAVCHRRGIVHREVKPDNIMFDEQDRLKLVDFGSAEVFRDGRMMSGIVGTPYYVAPEVLAGREYNEKVDVWSAGVILYVMLSGIVPFYGETAVEIFDKVIRGNLRFPMGVFQEVSPAAKDLMRRMMCKDVDRRLSAEQVLRHPWITAGGEARD